LNYKDSLGYIQIAVPAKAPNPINSVVVIDVTGVPKAAIKVTGIKVKGAGGLNSVPAVGGTLQMAITVTPSTATDKTVNWAVSDTTIASINKTGLVTAKKAGLVTVTATANDGSGIFGQIQITVGTTSTPIFPKSSSLKIYPNPANNGTVNLEYDNSTDLTSYSLVDLLGKEELSGTFINRTTIDLKNCEKGIYLIKVEDEDKAEVCKLIVN
jgi:uncharacterized protein YjdB